MIFYLINHTELEVLSKYEPVGMKDTPIAANKIMTVSGVKIGCHDFSFC